MSIKGVFLKKTERTCQHCGKIFLAYHSPSRKERGKYCSKTCSSSKSIDKKLWTRVIKTDTCWLWTGSCRSNGYGQICINNHQMSVHRVAYELFIGTIPKGLCVMHTCDIRNCINPYHLRLGTFKDNNQDAVNKKRHAFGERNGFSKLTNNAVTKIRQDNRHYKEIADDYQVSIYTIGEIKRRESWKHIP